MITEYRFKCQRCGRINKDVGCEGCGCTGEFELIEVPTIEVPIEPVEGVIVVKWRQDFCIQAATLTPDLLCSSISL